MLLSLLCALVLSYTLVCDAAAVLHEIPLPVASELFEFLTAEDLTTITFDQTVYFSKPDGIDVVAAPGIYRILLDEQKRMQLIPIKNNKEKEAYRVPAVPTNHRDKISTPVALYIPDEENIPHIVLLLPGGTGLEAVGSFSEVSTRGTTTPLLSPDQVHKAVLEKLRKAKSATPE
ncbi:MAG TPA: hypothetical protein VGJ57_07805 [Nitrospirales bacterium]|jgi:hypothetical protein